MDEVTTLQVVNFLVHAYPRSEISVNTVDIYVQLLSDIDPELLKMATLDYVSKNKWFPSVAELREAVGTLQEKSAGVPSSWDAWAEVNQMMRSYGYMRRSDFEFSSPLIDKAVDAVGGWRVLCHSENSVADRARFVEAYETYLKRQRDEVQTLPQVSRMIESLADKLRLKDGLK